MTGSFPRTWRQTALIMPFAQSLKRYYRARVHGLEQIPPDLPVVYVAKHPRTWLYFETMVFGMFAFWDAPGRIPIRVMEKKDTSVHRLPLVGWVRANIGCIEATEEAGIAALRRGESVLVFPGGARELYGAPDLIDWKGRRGFARIAAAAGAPVVPLAWAGADQQHPSRLRLGKRGSLWLPPLPLPVPLDFWFGAPLAPPPAGDADALAELAARAEREVQALLARATAARRPLWSLR